jgi:peptidoglycan/xylan/chitin deacetylase (PgdA/CDA1 family)
MLLHGHAKGLALSLLESSGTFRLGRWLSRGRLTSLTYHHVVPDPVDPAASRPPDSVYVSEFDRQVAYLSKHHHVVTGGELKAFAEHAVGLPAQSVLISFDDGYRDNYWHAYPILRRHGVSALFFLTSDFVSGREPRLWFDRFDSAVAAAPDVAVNWLRSRWPEARLDVAYIRSWLKRQRSAIRSEIVDGVEGAVRSATGSLEPSKHGAAMTWDEAREMAEAGMTMGAHSRTHQILAFAEPTDVESELAASRAEIERALSRCCWCFSYPNGTRSDFKPQHFEALRKAGFSCAFTQIPGLAGAHTERYALPRIPVPSAGDFRVFLSRACGLPGLLPSGAFA